MAKSTAGTKFRRDLLATVREVNRRMRLVTWDWGQGAVGKVLRDPQERANGPDRERWWRLREPSEYPENSAKALSRTYAELEAVEALVVAAKHDVAARWREVIALNQREVEVRQQEEQTKQQIRQAIEAFGGVIKKG